MIISHDLNSNGYLINNEIRFKVTSDEPVIYFTIWFVNLATGKITTGFVSYTDINNTININIQPIIKSLFLVPDGGTNNSTKIRISITASGSGTNIQFIKSFIRGGKRVNDINQTGITSESLRVSEMLPVWSGFPCYDYMLDYDYVIQQQNLSIVDNIDYRRIKGCNNIYLKFLNQNGGYSFWLFESYSEKESNTPLGSIIGENNNLVDLGSESKSGLQIYSKIPKEYKQYAFDLIVSADVYVYQNASWKKVFLKSNSVEKDNIKKVYTVNINIDLNYRFNPSLLWSN